MDFAMHARMTLAAFTLSLRRLARTPALLANFLFAAIPLVIIVLVHLFTLRRPQIASITAVHTIYEWFLRIFYLHFIVFFIANIMGSAVMRQEREEQTLHYLFLQPVRRWMLVCAKFAAYLIVATVLCVGSLWASYLALALPYCGVRTVLDDLFAQGRMMILARESLVIVLGLLAYGAFALLLGNFFKNATYSLLLLAWEAGLPYLPSTLKFWTISHYLQSLLPVKLTEQKELFQLLGDPATTAQSLYVLLGVPCLFLAVAVVCFRWRECLYGGET